MTAKNTAATVLLTLLLVACNKDKPAVLAQAQSLDFYSKNADVAMVVAEKCLDYERKELSKQPGGEQRTRHESADGVNCHNAKTARSFQIISEQQQRYLDSDKALK